MYSVHADRQMPDKNWCVHIPGNSPGRLAAEEKKANQSLMGVLDFDSMFSFRGWMLCHDRMVLRRRGKNYRESVMFIYLLCCQQVVSVTTAPRMGSNNMYLPYKIKTNTPAIQCYWYNFFIAAIFVKHHPKTVLQSQIYLKTVPS